MSAVSATIFDGLGKLLGDPPSRQLGRPRATPDDDEIDQHPFEHRIVPALGAPSVVPPGAIVSPFVSWRPSAGSADDAAQPPAAEIQEEPTVPKQSAATADKPRSLQQRICQAILDAGGVMTRAALSVVLTDLDRKQLSQALFMASAASRLRRTTAAGEKAWEVTAFGKRWLAGDNIEKPPAKRTGRGKAPKIPARRAKPGQRRANRPATVADAKAIERAIDTKWPQAARAVELVQERSFRCAVYSDGGFHLAKNGQQIDLDAAEHRQMLDYLERMAVETA